MKLKIEISKHSIASVAKVACVPLYEYQCKKCKHRFEKIQKFSSAPVKKCPECGGPVEKLISQSAVQFKGSGWYVTDYARKGSGSSDSKDSKDSNSSSSGDSKTAGEKSDKSDKTEKTDKTDSKKTEKTEKKPAKK